MCGIIAGVAQRDISPILLEGLRRLEYRGYDSAGLAVLSADHDIQRIRSLGKVAELEAAVQHNPPSGGTGIAHTRWATHGEPSEHNAHPHLSNNRVAIVHNGIIENFESLRQELISAGAEFESETDSEVIAHLIEQELNHTNNLLQAVKNVLPKMQGAYALGVIAKDYPNELITARKGSPLVIGVGVAEHFIASDVLALLPVTQRVVYLEEGDVAQVNREGFIVWDDTGEQVERPVSVSSQSADVSERGGYRHYMLKEIHEQPLAAANTISAFVSNNQFNLDAVGHHAEGVLKDIQRIKVVACGTSYHAALVSRYWFESLLNMPCDVEVASEFRYRQSVLEPNTLFVTLSQSGETADTMAALRLAKQSAIRASLSICNVPESSLTRESDLVMLTQAGPEIGVASTKAFTTQLIALLALVGMMAQIRGDADTAQRLIQELKTVPAQLESILSLEESIEAWVELLQDKEHALFLGRGQHYPIALEGALKLKEISYIHAEAYPAGELKHGPLALVDEHMPVIAVAPDDELFEKIRSNLEVVYARNGQLLVFVSESTHAKWAEGIKVMKLPKTADNIAPIVYVVPLQLLSYYTAVMKGTDVDQPRNLAKSVTVE